MATISYSNASKDMIYSIINALTKKSSLNIKGIFGDITGDELIKLGSDMNSLIKDLEDAFKELRDQTRGEGKFLTEYDKSKFYEEDILSQIVQLIQLQEYINTTSLITDDKIKIDVETYLNQYTQLNEKYFSDKGQIESITNFVTKYQQLTSQIMEVQDKLGGIFENIRGDKTYYGILLDLPGGKDASKLLKLSREQFTEFEKQNKDLFEIGFSHRKYDKNTKTWSGDSEGEVKGLKLKTGLEAKDVYQRMKMTFGEDFDKGQDILDQVYAVNNGGKAVTTRDVYKVLFSDTLGKNQNFKNINSGRKLEMLFDSGFRTQVVDYINNSETTQKNGKEFFSKQGLVEKLQNFDTSKFRGENVYGTATGDVNFNMKNGSNEAWQFKFKGNYLPWNGDKVQGAFDAISVLSTLYGVINNPSEFANGNFQDTFLSHFGLDSETFMEDPRVVSTTQEYLYQEAGDLFTSLEGGFDLVGFI